MLRTSSYQQMPAADLMRRLSVLASLLLALAVPAVGLADQAGAAGSPAPPAPRLLAFGGHFGGGHFGSGSPRLGSGRSLFRRGRGFSGAGRGASRGFLHSIARALAFGYILHLLFSHGALSLLVWLIIIGLVVLFFRARHRRRRVAY